MTNIKNTLKNNIIITDIGSTTTKALLLRKMHGEYKFVDYATAYTTVEKPYEDVKIGIINALAKLANKTKSEVFINNISDTSKENQAIFNLLHDYSYLSTSSAGGGLQILVIGLTKTDSARSATRVAYGVGGVLLDILTVEDGKSSFDKLNILNKSRPDIILFCGGVDGGALLSIYRLAEILKIANVKQKFSDKENTPLVYAGNQEAIDFIKLVFRNKYDLHLVSNIRPCNTSENLVPAKKKIHDLFLENVMEQAPGYCHVKKIVDSDIIPTPSGVLKALKLMGNTHKKIITFDIGGATTDVYSRVYGEHNRSVSANIGMSYSIGNIYSLADYHDSFEEYIQAFVTIDKPFDTSDFKKYFQNYVGNKILYPDFNPCRDIDKFIEHIIAICGIKISVKQHFDSHYKKKQNNVFEDLKKIVFFNKDEKIYTLPFDEKKTFKKSDFEMIIGAGGVISHASITQAVFILIESFNPKGVVELWRDKHFILPHLGVLSDVDETAAESVLYNDCLEKLALYIRPQISKYKTNDTLLMVRIDKDYHVKANDIFYFVSKESQKVSLSRQRYCDVTQTEFILAANIPLIIDTRNIHDSNSQKLILEKLRPYDFEIPEKKMDFVDFTTQYNNSISVKKLESINHQIPVMLPATGTIYVKVGDDVNPSTLIGEIRFDPPRIYLVLVSNVIKNILSEDDIREGLQVSVNDIVEIGSPLFKAKRTRYFVRSIYRGIVGEAANMTEKELSDDDIRNGELEKIQNQRSQSKGIFKATVTKEIIKKEDIVLSPIRGTVDQIDYQTGTIILKELQDYPLEPVEIDVAKKLNIKPTHILGYMKKREGEFVYTGEILAKRMSTPSPIMTQLFPESLGNLYSDIQSPYTGRVQEINTTTGVVTICYDKPPFRKYSLCYGKVESIVNNQEVVLNVKAVKIEGKIGFGNDVGGKLIMYNDDNISAGSIIFANNCVTFHDLLIFKESGIGGLVCNNISYSCLKKYLNKDVGVALTGNEILPFPIIILRGFTSEFVNLETSLFDLYVGNYALLKPQTQIRAGAIRPAVYLMKKH